MAPPVPPIQTRIADAAKRTLAARAFRLPVLLVWVTLAVAVLGGCDTSGPGEDDPRERLEKLAGGDMTVFEAGSQAFSQPAPNLSEEALAEHDAGDAAFDAQFVTAPANVNAGLGAAFNSNACVACHARDGRTQGEVLLHASSSGTGPNGGPALLEDFGLQIQDAAIAGLAPEADVTVRYEKQRGQFADGTSFTLREPVFDLEDPYRPLPADLQLSPRTPRPVFGLGLLEAVPAEAIRALAEKQAREGDVSGEANIVWDKIEQERALGRFGWKAERPSIQQQTADAYHRDMGITSPLLPRESTRGQDDYDDGLDDDPEITRETVAANTFYVQTLGVPARRGLDDPAVQRGSELFAEIGCASCHVRRLETGRPEGPPESTHDQTIFPYTDMLVHDMGEGLADDRPVFEAGGREWRTPPLWGLGLSEVVSGHTNLLHDGRARNVTEAILWHGGEAEASREAFRQLSREERDDLRAFLRSL
jgi:CxxC motif-containing protein (DUF1111 family)